MVNTRSPKPCDESQLRHTRATSHTCSAREGAVHVSTGNVPEHHPRQADVPATSTSSGSSGGLGLSSLRPNPPRTNVPVPNPSRDTNQWEIPVPATPRAAHPSTSLTAMNPIAGGAHATLVAAIDSKLDHLVEHLVERFGELENHQDIADSHYDDTEQHIEQLLQWTQSHDKSEHAPTDNDLFSDGWLTGNNPRGQSLLGQPTPSAEQAQTQQPNNSSAQPGGRQASTSTNSSNEPQGGLRNPTDGLYFWNDDVHKDIIDDCDHQDHINWDASWRH